MIRIVKALAAAAVLAGFLFAASGADDEEAGDGPEPGTFVEVFLEPGEEPFPMWWAINSRLRSIESATPAFVISKLVAGVPVVGGSLLPDDRYFSVELGDDPPDREVLLARLGAVTGLKIELRDWEGEFLAVRLRGEAIPAFWEPAETGDGVGVSLSGVMERGDVGGFYEAIGCTVEKLIAHFAFSGDAPAIDLTGLRRGYNYVFEFGGGSFGDAMDAAGLSVSPLKTKRRAVVISEP